MSSSDEDLPLEIISSSSKMFNQSEKSMKDNIKQQEKENKSFDEFESNNSNSSSYSEKKISEKIDKENDDSNITQSKEDIIEKTNQADFSNNSPESNDSNEEKKDIIHKFDAPEITPLNDNKTCSDSCSQKREIKELNEVQNIYAHSEDNHNENVNVEKNENNGNNSFFDDFISTQGSELQTTIQNIIQNKTNNVSGDKFNLSEESEKADESESNSVDKYENSILEENSNTTINIKNNNGVKEKKPKTIEEKLQTEKKEIKKTDDKKSIKEKAHVKSKKDEHLNNDSNGNKIDKKLEKINESPKNNIEINDEIGLEDLKVYQNQENFLHNSPRSDANTTARSNLTINQDATDIFEDSKPLPLKKLSEIHIESSISNFKSNRTNSTTAHSKQQKSKYTLDDDPDVPVFSWQKKDQDSKKQPKRSISPNKQGGSQQQLLKKPPINSMFITQVSEDVKTVDDEKRLRIIVDEKKKKRTEVEKKKKDEEDKLKKQLEAVKIELFEEEKKKQRKTPHEEEVKGQQHSQIEEDKQKKVIKKPNVTQQHKTPPKKMTYAMMAFTGISPTIPVSKQIDLSKYDYIDFDESLAANIPIRLLDLVTHGKESIVFRALCGVSIIQYPSGVVSRVLMELKHYLDLCIEKGLIAEASYVQCIIEAIKDERNEKAKVKDNSLEKVNKRLAELEAKYEKRKRSWENQKTIMLVDKDLQNEDLELRYQEESIKLNEEWNSEKMQNRYNKPSPMLIQMRHNARSLLQAHRFEEAAAVAEDIQKREARETEEAANRMSHGYQAAIIRLRDKFESERETMDDSFRVKYSALLRAEETNLKPIQQRICQYKTMKEDYEIANRRSKTSYGRPKSHRKPLPISSKHPPIIIDAKLKLPPLSKQGTKLPIRDIKSAMSDV